MSVTTWFPTVAQSFEAKQQASNSKNGNFHEFMRYLKPRKQLGKIKLYKI